MTQPMTYDPPQPNAALVVGPDDVLVLCFRSLTPQDVDRLKADMGERFPGLVDRVLFANATDMAVVRPSELEQRVSVLERDAEQRRWEDMGDDL